MTPATNNLRHLPELDAWRALAAGLVVVGHIVQTSGADISNIVPFVRYFSVGVMSVDVFFFISGFVICRGLLFEEKAGPVSMTNFYIRRFFRIVPCLALYLAVASLLGGLGVIDYDVRQTLAAASFSCNLPDNNCRWFVAHTWSLAFEEQFYIAFPLLFIAFSGKRRAIALWALFVALVALSFIKTALHWPGQVYGLSFSLLAAGVLCAVHEVRVRSLVARLPSVLVLLAIPVLVMPYLAEPHRYLTALHYLTVHACIAVLVLRTLNAPGVIGSVFRWSPLLYIGKISYGVYLWQQLATADPSSVPWSYSMGLVAMSLIAITSFHFVEQPLVAKGKSIIARRLAKSTNARAMN